MTSEAGLLRCPSCGGPCSPDARTCPHCDVEVASVRCGHCFALHFVGAKFCARCGKELTPEPVLDAVDAPCPRCAHRLSAPTGGTGAALADEGRYECTACGGIFVDRAALERILAREARPDLGESTTHTTSHAIAAHVSEPVRYLHCPMCNTIMNRVHFAHHSGVVVSVCKEHGTWFDAGELTTVIEFVSAGG
jgi:Zn-finger nucleic acid-binding protein